MCKKAWKNLCKASQTRNSAATSAEPNKDNSIHSFAITFSQFPSSVLLHNQRWKTPIQEFRSGAGLLLCKGIQLSKTVNSIRAETWAPAQGHGLFLTCAPSVRSALSDERDKKAFVLVRGYWLSYTARYNFEYFLLPVQPSNIITVTLQ